MPKSCEGAGVSFAKRRNGDEPEETLSHLKTLSKVHNLESSALVKLGKINDELMSTTTLVVDKLDSVVILKTSHGVVGVEKGEVGRVGETGTTEHLDVGPRDGEDRSGTVRSC